MQGVCAFGGCRKKTGMEGSTAGSLTTGMPAGQPSTPGWDGRAAACAPARAETPRAVRASKWARLLFFLIPAPSIHPPAGPQCVLQCRCRWGGVGVGAWWVGRWVGVADTPGRAPSLGFSQGMKKKKMGVVGRRREGCAPALLFFFFSPSECASPRRALPRDGSPGGMPTEQAAQGPHRWLPQPPRARRRPQDRRRRKKRHRGGAGALQPRPSPPHHAPSPRPPPGPRSPPCPTPSASPPPHPARTP